MSERANYVLGTCKACGQGKRLIHKDTGLCTECRLGESASDNCAVCGAELKAGVRRGNLCKKCYDREWRRHRLVIPFPESLRWVKEALEDLATKEFRTVQMQTLYILANYLRERGYGTDQRGTEADL